jgi:hypothetical protein
LTSQTFREVLLVETEISEISNALEAFKAEIASGASGGDLLGRLIKKDGG